MSKLKFVLLLAVGLVAGVALGVPSEKIDIIDSIFPQWFQSGIFVSPASIEPAAGNKVTRILGASGTIDFASIDDGYNTSSTITVTGARQGDPCFVGSATNHAAAAVLRCNVSASDTVTVFLSNSGGDGGALDLASATYYVRVVSSQ